MSTAYLPAMGTDREADKIKIKQILTATIVSLCNNGLSFDSELCVEGLLGITLDKRDVLLVNIKETVNSSLKKKAKASEGPAQGSRQQQTTANKPQQPTTANKPQQPTTSNKQQPQQMPRKAPQQPQQSPQQMPRKQQQQQHQDQPPTPGKLPSQESFGRVKTEPMIPKVVSESQTQCMAVQPYGGGYSQVQKSVKTVQNAQGVVEQKQMEWRTYAADGRVLEHKKVQEVQTVAPSAGSVQGGFAGQPMTAATMSGYEGQNIKVEPGCEDNVYGHNEEEEYYEDEEQDYDDYDCMREGYPDAREQYPAGAYSDQNQQFGPGMDGMGYQQAQGSGRGRGGKTARKPAVKRPKKEKMMPSKSTPSKKSMKLQMPVMAAPEPSPSKNTPPPKGNVKDVNSTLVQRALDMVNEGKLSAAAAINLFGIPKSTFYKKLATSNAERGQFGEGGDMEGMEEGWDDGMQGSFDLMDPAYADYNNA